MAHSSYHYTQALSARALANHVKVDQQTFETVLEKSENPLVLIAPAGFIRSLYRYVTSYKGIVFYLQTDKALNFNEKVECIYIKKIEMPPYLW